MEVLVATFVSRLVPVTLVTVVISCSGQVRPPMLTLLVARLHSLVAKAQMVCLRMVVVVEKLL